MKKHVTEIESTIIELIQKFYKLKEREESLGANGRTLILIQGGLKRESACDCENVGSLLVGHSEDSID